MPIHEKFIKLICLAARVLFSAGAFLLLIYSVCDLALFGYVLYNPLLNGHHNFSSPDMVLMLVLGGSVFVSSFFIISSRAPWLEKPSLILAVCGCIFAAGLCGLWLCAISTPWKGDELRMGAGIGSIFLFLLLGTVAKARGIWALD